MTGGFMLDASALIAVDRGDRRMLVLLEAARRAGLPLAVTAPAISQAWRTGRSQARLAAFLKQPVLQVASFAKTEARAVGELAALSRHDDVVDVHVALLASQRDQTVITSDPDDILRVDPRLRVVAV